MRYMLLIYKPEVQEATPPSADDYRAGMEAHCALMEETKQKGIYIGAQPLKPSATATTVRLRDDGTPLVTDGPFAETKEQLAGYYLLNCKDLHEAIHYATRIQGRRCTAGFGGGVEVRPVLEFAEIQRKLDELLASQPA